MFVCMCVHVYECMSPVSVCPSISFTHQVDISWLSVSATVIERAFSCLPERTKKCNKMSSLNLMMIIIVICAVMTKALYILSPSPLVPFHFEIYADCRTFS